MTTLELINKIKHHILPYNHDLVLIDFDGDVLNFKNKIKGIYFLIDDKDDIIYIGYSLNVPYRIFSHFNNGNSLSEEVKQVKYLVADEKHLTAIEAELIAFCKPRYNNQRRITKEEKEKNYQRQWK